MPSPFLPLPSRPTTVNLSELEREIYATERVRVMFLVPVPLRRYAYTSYGVKFPKPLAEAFSQPKITHLIQRIDAIIAHDIVDYVVLYKDADGHLATLPGKRHSTQLSRLRLTAPLSTLQLQQPLMP